MAVRLILTGSAEEQWRDITEPWFAGQNAWRDPRPTVVLTPNRAHGFYLRSRIIERGRGALGVRFWTPTDARKYLLGGMKGDIRAVPQFELRLLTRLCAERLLKDEKVVDRASLESVIQDPEAFLRAYDLVVGAGWDPARDGADYGRMLASELGRDLQRAQIDTQGGIHRLLRNAPCESPPLLARVLILGFNASHWPLWDLLQAVCRAATDSLVAFDPPAAFGEAVDQLWIGSWEEFAGTGFEIRPSENPEIESSPLESLATSYESGTHQDAAESDIHFIVTADLTTQIQSIVLQSLDYLRRPECTRLGIVFPEANALALGVTQQLQALGLPLDDGPGAFQNGLFETRPWQTWIQLQEEPTVRRFIHWIRACESSGVSCGLPLPAARVSQLLDRALGQSLIDDLGFLALQMEREKGDQKVVADFLRKRVALPPEGFFTAYLESTRSALRGLKWNAFLEQIPEFAPSWITNATPLARSTYLAWLKDVADTQERTRPGGNHFYGKIHLLVYGQISGQTWSHLILTGLNEGVWPRFLEPGAFGSRYQLTELNEKSRLLNRKATTQGGQGAGHPSVLSGHGHCLLPTEHHDLLLRDLCAAVRATHHAVCLTAMTLGGGRNLLPSDFFNHAWQAKTGRVLEDTMFGDLAKLTAQRAQQSAGLLPSRAVSAQDISSTRIAFDARRDSTQPFGHFEFSYATPPAAPIQLPCKKWQDALDYPARIWLSEVIGVSPWPEGDLNWPLAMGTWVHRWLADSLREGASSEFPKMLRTAATKELSSIEKRAHTAGIKLYPWWKHVWGQARNITLGLGATLAPELMGKKILSEISLPSGLLVALPGGAVADFILQGKLDLLLIEPDTRTIDATRLDLAGTTCWVIDFKTGTAKKLTSKLLGKGSGIQITLYGLAVRALGAESTFMTLHTFDTPLTRQADIIQLLPELELFRILDTIHRLGIFGQTASAENEFVYQPDFPITTRSISPEILAAKWDLVHEKSRIEETS